MCVLAVIFIICSTFLKRKVESVLQLLQTFHLYYLLTYPEPVLVKYCCSTGSATLSVDLAF
jgi:hypothetical protein